MIELCREGEISVVDAEHIISGEWFNAIGLERELTEDLDDLRQTTNHRMKDVVIIQEEITHVQKMLDIIAEYIAILENNKALSDILLSDDYKLKRKTKTQGIIGYEDKETQIQEAATPPQNSEPNAYLYELAALFDCSTQAIFYMLKKMNITLKKRPLLIAKNPKQSV
jgi:hypothetical protein